MNYLITGGAGFIGAHLTEQLLQSGHRVSVLDDLSTGSLENLAAVNAHPELEFIEGNILDSPDLERLTRNADCVFHLAAAVGVELVVHDPVRTIMTNVGGSERVLKTAAAHRKRILVASTSEVYGKSRKEVFSETDDLVIGPSTHSRWSYACSKLLDEFLLMAYHRDHGLPGTVVRFFNTVGPRQTGRYGMVIPRFVAAALRGEPLRVFGTGEQTRCFCHVFDTIRALRQIADSDSSIGRLYNIGSNRSISIMDLARLVVQRTGSSSAIETVPYSVAYEKGFEDMLHRAPDCSRIAEEFDWEARFSLEQIIDDVIASVR